MVKLLAAVAVILAKLVTAPDGHEDVAEGEPVGDVEQHEGGGEHYPGYAVLTHNCSNTHCSRAVNGPSRSYTVHVESAY